MAHKLEIPFEDKIHDMLHVFKLNPYKRYLDATPIILSELIRDQAHTPMEVL